MNKQQNRLGTIKAAKKTYQELHKEFVDKESKVLDGMQATFRRFGLMNEFFNLRDYFINHSNETLVSNIPTSLQSVIWRMLSTDPTVDINETLKDIIYVIISSDTYITHNSCSCYVTYKRLEKLNEPYEVIWVIYQYVYNKFTDGHNLVFPPTHPLASGSNNPDNVNEIKE